MPIFAFLCAAGFIAGFIDAVAGGGGLITLPSLLAAGLPPHIALGTNKFQSMFGTSFALLNFTRKRKVVWRIAAVGVPAALAGAVIGAKTALFVPPSLVAKIIVAVIPPLAAFVFFSGRVLRLRHETETREWHIWVLTPLACLAIGTYDGFLGPGTGTFLIIALAFLPRIQLVEASATAKIFNLASNAGAFVTFLVSGCVYFPYAMAMAGFNILGNIMGSHYAMKHGQEFIKKILLVSLSLLFIYLVWKYF
jgi:uncharacterized membrane protein YfcA